MPLTTRGRMILEQLPGALLRGDEEGGCEIMHLPGRCVGCGCCVRVCPAQALTREPFLEVSAILAAPPGTPRGELGAALKVLARREPEGPVPVPERTWSWRALGYAPERCLGCGACTRVCPSKALERRPPRTGGRP
jgi:ferredoxin